MVLLLFCILGFSAVVALLLFGDSPAYRNTPIHTVHLHLVRVNSKVSSAVLASPRLYSFLRWLVPVFYCCAVLFCLFQFFAYVYVALDPAIAASHAHSAYIGFSIAAVVLSTALVTFSDPGTVTPANVSLACSKYTNDGLIFFGKSCATCHFEKPARSKHCSVCNRCILLYDHHCIWVNNCIGYSNYRWFLLFLVLNINMMVYGACLCWGFLSSQNSLIGWWTLIVATTESNRIAGILLILASIISVITALFTALHLRYLYLGVTTNEAEKWGEIEHLVSLGVLYYIVEKQLYVEEASVRHSDGTFEVVYIGLNDEKVHYSDTDRGNYTFVKVSLVENDLVNVYDHGFVANVKERVLMGA